MVEHVSITDPNIHKTKGVASAANGTVHAANAGDGTWVLPYTLSTTRKLQVLQGSQAANQLIASADTPQTVLFGGLQALADINLAATGIITINTTGYYEFKFNLSFGRTTGTGISTIFSRLLIGGVATGFTQVVKLDTPDITVPFQADFTRFMTAGETVSIEIMRDSVGLADGGLIAVTPTDPAFTPAPSAWVRVVKVQGAVS